MSDETDDATKPRPSRFREHTNTNSTIRPPPDELWKDIGVEELIDQFNEENALPPKMRKTSANYEERVARPAHSRTLSGPAKLDSASSSSGGGSSSGSAAASGEGAYARIQRAFASMFGGVLGKRKAGSTDAERDREQHQQLLDERKRAAEIAYYDAKERGLLPTPKVFVRPGMAARVNGRELHYAEKMQLGLTTELVEAATPVRTPRTPGTPNLHRMPSKKDLQKQKKLTKRVSDLEFKLASARKELHTVLYNDMPPVPPIPKFTPLTPDVTQSENEAASPEVRTSTLDSKALKSMGRLVKRRKTAAHDSDSEYRPVPTDSEGDTDMVSVPSASEHEGDDGEDEEDEDASAEPASKRSKGRKAKNSQRQSSRLRKKFSRSSIRHEEPVSIIPDGVTVPLVPSLPKELEAEANKNSRGKQASARDDGYGGLGHEIFDSEKTLVTFDSSAKRAKVSMKTEKERKEKRRS